jgi:hypothetical protein
MLPFQTVESKKKGISVGVGVTVGVRVWVGNGVLVGVSVGLKADATEQPVIETRTTKAANPYK